MQRDLLLVSALVAGVILFLPLPTPIMIAILGACALLLLFIIYAFSREATFSTDNY